MLIPFGPYAPDKPARLNDGVLRTASGVYPMPEGYRPIGQWAQVISALPSAPKGGASFTSPYGVSSIIAGTQGALYHGTTAGFVEIGSNYSVPESGRWRFAQFGGLAIATNGSDPMQKIDLSDFTVEALAGSPPKAEMLAVVKDFLVAGVVDGQINTIRWSAINNAEGWTVGLDQSDIQVFPDGGRVNGLVSGEIGLVLQRNAIRRIAYVGGNLIFTIDNTHPGVGCVSVHTLAQWGRMAWFWSDLGPMEWDGADVSLIGDELVTRYIQSRYGKDAWPSVSTAVDPVNGVVMWAVPASGSTAAQLIGFHWRLRRWFTAPYDSPIIFGGVTRDITMDDQDPATGAADDDMDGSGLITLDDSSFRGGDPRLYAFNGSYALGAFTGTPMAATLELGDLELVKGARSNIRMCRVETDATSGVTLTLSHKERLGDAATDDSYTSITASGDMPVRTSGRYVRPKVQIAAGTDWSFIQAIDLTAQKAGGR